MLKGPAVLGARSVASRQCLLDMPRKKEKIVSTVMTATEEMMQPSGSQVAVLHRISSIVSSNLTLDKMLQELVDLTLQVTACDACLVYLVDHASGEIVLRASQLPHDAEIGNIRLKMGEGITGWVALHRSVVALPENAAADYRFKVFQTLPEDTYEAFLSVPLVTSGDLIGVINVHHRDKHSHTPDEVALLTFIGEQMGGAIAKSRLAKHSESAVKRMEALAAVAQAISAESYLDRILQVISEMVAETLDSPVCSIMLVDEERRELVICRALFFARLPAQDAAQDRGFAHRARCARGPADHNSQR